jgi:hypothetical protein
VTVEQSTNVPTHSQHFKDSIMQLLLSLTLVVATLFSLLSSAVPTPTTHWTYQDLLDYGIERGGTDDTTAQTVRLHITMSGKQWNDPYEHDIITDNGGVLVVASTNFTGGSSCLTSLILGRSIYNLRFNY